MPRRNRVDPWGDLHAVAATGCLTGNRGCLVDDERRLVAHHRGSLWISCVLDFRGWRQPLDAPHRWTPLFFLDEAVALAAGHRPCGMCRRAQYVAYRDAVAAGTGVFPTAAVLNRMLAAERLRLGRGIDRADDRRMWTAALDKLPPGAVVVDETAGARGAALVGPGTLGVGRGTLGFGRATLQPFTFGGWGEPFDLPSDQIVSVLTPPTSVAALTHGYRPVLHPSAAI